MSARSVSRIFAKPISPEDLSFNTANSPLPKTVSPSPIERESALTGKIINLPFFRPAKKAFPLSPIKPSVPRIDAAAVPVLKSTLLPLSFSTLKPIYPFRISGFTTKLPDPSSLIRSLILTTEFSAIVRTLLSPFNLSSIAPPSLVLKQLFSSNLAPYLAAVQSELSAQLFLLL